jgi:ribosomal protein L13, bacterial type
LVSSPNQLSLHLLSAKAKKHLSVDSLSYKTSFANKDSVNHNWYLVDAEDKVVGRLASEIARLIRGKHKPDFTPHVNCGDKVVVINADKVRFTGNKFEQKIYRSYSGYPSGQKEKTPREFHEYKPNEILRKAVLGMLPKNKLQKRFMNNLFLYAGPEHQQEAQQPEKIDL